MRAPRNKMAGAIYDPTTVEYYTSLRAFWSRIRDEWFVDGFSMFSFFLSFWELSLHAERNLAFVFHDRMGKGRALKFMGFEVKGIMELE